MHIDNNNKHFVVEKKNWWTLRRWNSSTDCLWIAISNNEERSCYQPPRMWHARPLHLDKMSGTVPLVSHPTSQLSASRGKDDTAHKKITLSRTLLDNSATQSQMIPSTFWASIHTLLLPEPSELQQRLKQGLFTLRNTAPQFHRNYHG